MSNKEASQQIFSDPEFSARLEEHGGSFSAQAIEEYDERQRTAEDEARIEKLAHLRTIAHGVAQAAADRVPGQQIYDLQDKTGLKKFMNNRGKQEMVDGGEGWVLVEPPSGSFKKSPGRASLTNGAMGLILTKEGRLYPAISRKDLKPFHDRFETIERTKIQRNTFFPQERSAWYHPPVPKDTFAPRYRPFTDGLPTIVRDSSDHEDGLDNDYFTLDVLDQCYDALAEFVHENNLQSAPEEPTEETAVREPAENEAATEVMNAAEKLSDQEKIDQWLDEGVVVVKTWREHDGSDETRQGATSFKTTYSNPEFVEDLVGWDEANTAMGVEQAFVDDGVDEIVTVSRLMPVEDIDPGSEAADEKLVRIAYEVPNSSGSDTYSPEAGQTFRSYLFLPESEAKDFIRRISKNPSLIRDINDRFMPDAIGGKAWDEAKPKYDKLKEQRGGKSKIAFRTSFSAKPEASKILAY